MSENPSPPPADRELIEAWLAHLEMAKGRRPRTLETYRLALARLVEFMAGRPLAEAEPIELVPVTSPRQVIRSVAGAVERDLVEQLVHDQAATVEGLTHGRHRRQIARHRGERGAHLVLWSRLI